MTDASTAAPAAAHWQKAVVTSTSQLTSNIKSFVLAPSRPFRFIAGQHVDVRLTAPDGYRAIRSYSIASSPERVDGIELAVERLTDGEVSPFFHDVVQVGDEIELRGPLGGHFIWSTGDGGPLLLIGGGSGVVPLASMIRHREAAGSDVAAVLLLSARTWQDVLYRDELLAIEEARNGFSLALTVTREAPRRDTDFSRRIDPRIVADVIGRLPAAPRYTFVCGTNSFVNAGADGALAAGVAAATIRTERYGGA